MSSITLFGAGSWGTALSVHLASAGRDVVLWARRPEVAKEIRRTSHNPTYLPELLIPSSVHITTDLQTAAEASNTWGMAVPSQKLRKRLEALRPHVHEDVRLVALSKGIENETLLTMSQVMDDVFERVPRKQIGVLYGPSHAEEVAEGRPTAIVAAAPHEEEARKIQKAFMTDRLRVYVNTDVLGVEIGGSAKNVLAIAAGIADGAGYGDNAKAALVTRGLAEIRRLGQALGASQHSRNRYLGEQISTGKSLDEVINEMEMIAEGVRTTRSVYNLSKHHGVEMPITEAVHAILFDDKSPRKMVKRLMTRSAKHENWLPATLER
ncbi:MAG: glycerol-3-phosphate dehydrogenase [Bacteroidetes bacterium QH_2_63_10]|nr:MAG: glycerol-3-phosphate dehydrogenase [Bacteroidetes bacterium QH_2_63_10]